MNAANVVRVRWFARAALGIVFAWNVQCALVFLLAPERYAPGLELAGLPGRVAVQAFGVLFLMWNATFPPVIINPDKNRTLFGVVLVQQAIGVVGDLWLRCSLPAGHEALGAAILRFVAFDAAGLLLLTAAYALLRIAESRAWTQV